MEIYPLIKENCNFYNILTNKSFSVSIYKYLSTPYEGIICLSLCTGKSEFNSLLFWRFGYFPIDSLLIRPMFSIVIRQH